MVSLLGDVSDGFGKYGVFLYDFMSELVYKINGYVFIGTGFLSEYLRLVCCLLPLQTP